MWTDILPAATIRFTPQDALHAGRSPERGPRRRPPVPAAYRSGRFHRSGAQHQAVGDVEIVSNERLRMPCQPLAGERHARVEQVVSKAIKGRSTLPAV